jgi:hypothetical protein
MARQARRDVDLDLPRFRGHCSPWGEEGVHDAEDTTAVPTAASGATD